MTDRPILFSGPMVRALLDGRKTQTRRVIKPQPDHAHEECWTVPHCPVCDERLPYAPGDRLWVKEAWRAEARYDRTKPRDIPVGRLLTCDADCDYEPNDGCRGKGRPSIFMPRWASRLTLIVSDVRVQRVQDISGEDCLAEGLHARRGAPMGVYDDARQNNPEASRRWNIGMRSQFKDLWNSINAERGFGWDVNPWVTALTFTVHQTNIDAMGNAE